MTKVDEKDIAILEVLSADSSLSTSQISKQTGIPTTTVHQRITKLKKEGVIKAYTIDIDYAKLNKEVIIYILLIYDMNEMERAGIPIDNLTKRFRDIPEVIEIAYITGRFDILLKVRLGNMNELSRFVLNKLRKIPGIVRTESLQAFYYTDIKRV